MTKLETLYASIKGLQDLGLPLNDETLKAADELEEQLIKTEILPAMSKDIEPMLSQIQRELVLVVEYKPGTPISVALSRKTNIAELLDAKILEQDPQAEHKEGKKHEKPIERINGKTVLKVTFPDGTVIADKKAKITFAETIKRIGLMKVRNLGISFCHVPIVSNTLDKKYGKAQIPVGDGLYVMTHSSTHDKKKQLDKIAKDLGIKLIVEEI
jgi:hypothetical protein